MAEFVFRIPYMGLLFSALPMIQYILLSTLYHDDFLVRIPCELQRLWTPPSAGWLMTDWLSGWAGRMTTRMLPLQTCPSAHFRVMSSCLPLAYCTSPPLSSTWALSPHIKLFFFLLMHGENPAFHPPRLARAQRELPYEHLQTRGGKLSQRAGFLSFTGAGSTSFFFIPHSFPSSSFISFPSSPLPCQTAGYCVWLAPPKDDFQIDKVTTAAITRGGRCRTFPCLRIWSQWTPCSRLVTLLQQVV